MGLNLQSRRQLIWWQLLFLVFSSLWLWAPSLNHMLSYRTALISQYETPYEPYSWLFRFGDILAAGLIILIASQYRKHSQRRIASYLLLIIGFGFLVDALVPTACHLQGGSCKEYFSLPFLIHALETFITASAAFVISIYDVWLRRRLASVAFVVFQVGYLVLFMSQLASQDRFNTTSQYLYQLVLIVWIAWYCQDFLVVKKAERPLPERVRLVRYASAAWAFLNGLLAISISLAHLDLFGKIRGLYFAGDSAWLAQHGVVIGVIMLYLSRQLARGELRARQIFLFITGIETLKYAVITPRLPLMLLYLVSFCGLFVLRDNFDRGVIPITLKVRLKDALFMLAATGLVAIVALGLLLRNHELSDITHQSIDHFFDYTLRSGVPSKLHTESALLAHTITAFVLASLGTLLWILFRPQKKITWRKHDYPKVEQLINKYSTSPDDYFKLWPKDKQYFWAKNRQGFIAYKIVGSTAFALADPIGPASSRGSLIADFVRWARGRRLKTCFLPINPSSLPLYEKAGLESLQIGSSAVINIEDFLQKTAQEKWWRWQRNRAQKAGYQYCRSLPPHPQELITRLKRVSDAWLTKEGRQERSFALGYFDRQYIGQCQIHYLNDKDGQAVAFTNQLPSFTRYDVASVDLLRHRPDVDNAMPYLLFKTIVEMGREDRYKEFDLGFVPFTASRELIVGLARVLGSGRFSAKGLEQFKNKFKPDWRPNYLAYDGDLGDLAIIGINLEKALDVE